MIKIGKMNKTLTKIDKRQTDIGYQLIGYGQPLFKSFI
jgi:hypothetical protein